MHLNSCCPSTTETAISGSDQLGSATLREIMKTIRILKIILGELRNNYGPTIGNYKDVAPVIAVFI